MESQQSQTLQIDNNDGYLLTQIKPLHDDIKKILQSVNEIKHFRESNQGTDSIRMESKEIKSLRAQLRGMEILMQQNCALEKEVESLCKELDDVTLGVQKKGYLYKWRDRDISFASKWSLRYFVLQGNKLSYYVDDKELKPRRTFDLSKCFVREEGTRKGGLYFIFSIYLSSSDNSELDGSLLLRLSTDIFAESALWIDMFEQACAISDMDTTPNSPLPNSVEISSLSPIRKKELQSDEIHTAVFVNRTPSKLILEGTNEEDWSNVPIDSVELDSQLGNENGMIF